MAKPYAVPVESVRKNLHLMSIFDCAYGLTLYQRTVESRSNEIPAVRALLDVLDISDSIVTLDALHCQKALLKQIESELLPKLTEQVRDRVLFNEADYQRNREEFRYCAITWFRKIT